MNNIIKVLILSMLPISELRGAIPYGVSLGFSPLKASIISIFGNAIIVPILFFLLKPVFEYLKKIDSIKNFIHSYEKRAGSKLAKYEKYKFWGIVLLVGVPLPTTGVYTGIVASHVVGMDAKKSILANIIGVCISGTIMFILTSGVLRLFFN